MNYSRKYKTSTKKAITCLKWKVSTIAEDTLQAITIRNHREWHDRELCNDPLLYMPAATQRHWKAIIRIPLFSMVIKQGKCFLISHPLSLSTITQTLKHFFLKQTKLSRSTFSQLIYMPFRLCFMNPIYHVFFHHKMLGDYAECHPNRVVWIAANLWKCSAAGERKRKKHAHTQLGKSREHTLLNLY